MRIGVDFDGVIADCGKLKCATALEMYGIIIPEEKFKWEILTREGILTDEQYRSLQKKIYDDLETGLRATPVTGALKHIKKLLNNGHELTVVTSRFGPSLAVAQEWAKLHALEIPFIGVGYPNSKESAARDLGLDVFIDDDLEKLQELATTVPNLFLFSWGYNQHINENGLSTRVSSWEDFYNRITKIGNN